MNERAISDLMDKLAARDATIASLRAELKKRALDEISAIGQAAEVEAELRAEVERLRDAMARDLFRTGEQALRVKAEAEVERLRDALADEEGTVEAMQARSERMGADLDEARAVIRDAAAFIRKGQWPSVYHTWEERIAILDRAAAVLVKGEGER